MNNNYLNRKHVNTFEIYCHSDKGDRENQEDYYCVSYGKSTMLATICDGIGGCKGGEIASHTAIQYLHHKFECIDATDVSFYTDLIDELDTQVFFLKDKYNRRLRAGTTIASVLINGNRLDWFSVGDSRVYIIRESEMIQVTRDHNFKELLIEYLKDGRITKEQFYGRSYEYAKLISYIGMGGIQLYNISKNSLQLRKGDLILIMSDGLYKSVDMEQILPISRYNTSLIMKKLCEMSYAEKTKHRDNTTFILIRYI
ncbi:MAG: serine/threonine-protein phosphatase [Ruminococcus sp.]|nr:serine/threonine-protein phosphatase [Ruminococcus sp.]